MTVKFYEHFSDIPSDEWFWDNFKPSEIASKSDGSIIVDYDAMDKIQRLRNMIGKPLKINSAYRDVEYNTLIGGSKRSMHLEGRAFDISNKNHDCKELYKYAKLAGFVSFGFYRTFLHVDTGLSAAGKSRKWGSFQHLYI